MKKKYFRSIIFIIFFGIVFVGIGYTMSGLTNPSFANLDSKQMYQTLLKYQDVAIQKAVEDGSYKCCINPPCTMCYMQANKWNNYIAGTCACDELIAKGETPCPQCQNGICEKDKQGVCKINSNTGK